MPRWVPDSLRGRSFQGLLAYSRRMSGHLRGPAVEMATDLSLLTPSPDTTEKTLMRLRAGAMVATESPKKGQIVGKSIREKALHKGELKKS